MAKKSLINVWQWWDMKLLTMELSSMEQLIIFHLIRFLNKSFWSPAQISINKFAAEMKCDKRTVKKALDSVIQKGLVLSTKNGYLLNIEDIQSEIFESSFSKKEVIMNGETGNSESSVFNLRNLLDSEGVSNALTSPRTGA